MTIQRTSSKSSDDYRLPDGHALPFTDTYPAQALTVGGRKRYGVGRTIRVHSRPVTIDGEPVRPATNRAGRWQGGDIAAATLVAIEDPVYLSEPWAMEVPDLLTPERRAVAAYLRWFADTQPRRPTPSGAAKKALKG